MATTGLKPNSSNIFQLVEEATPGTYDAAGNRYVMTSLRVEPQPEDVFDSFKPQGWNARAWSAITRGHTVLSGAVRLDFRQMDVLLSLLCGAPYSDSTGSGVRTRVYRLKDTGADSRTPYTSEFGSLLEASRYPFTLLAALSLNFMRMTENNEGSVTLLARQPLSDAVPLTGAVAQDAVFVVTAEDAVEGCLISFPATSEGAGGDVSIDPGDASSAIDTEIQGLDGYPAVTVSGSTPSAYGANVTAGGTASGSSPLGGNVASNVIDGNTGTYWQTNLVGTQMWQVHLTAPATIGKLRIYSGGSNLGPADFTVRGSLTGAWAGEDTLLLTSSGNTYPTAGWYEFPLDEIVSSEYVRIDISAMQGGGTASLVEVELRPLTPSSGSYTVTVTTPQEQIETPEIVGDGWTIERTAPGSTGIIAPPTHVPILPQMWTARRASSYATLGAATAIPKVKGLGLDFPDRALLHWFFDENDTDFDDWVQGEGEVTARLTMVNDTDGVAADLHAKSKQVPATPEWWRFKAVHPDLDYSLQIDGNFAVSGSIPYGTENNVRHREFPLAATLNDQGWLLEITTRVPG